MRAFLTTIFVSAAVLAGAVAVGASAWPGWPLAGSDPRVEPSETLGSVARLIATLPATETDVPLAIEATQVGHWRLVNRRGEPFTASGADELARGIEILAPAASARPERLVLHLTADTVFRHRGAIGGALPEAARLAVAIDGRAFPLVRIGRGAEQRFGIELERGLVLEAEHRAQFDEVRWQLRRPLVRSRVRTLAFSPGGPTHIARAPKVDAGSRRAMPDAVDPQHIGGAMAGLAGQTVLAAGRLDGDRLRFVPATGLEATIDIGRLAAAARSADVNLIALATTSPRQPGTRNWLLQRVALAQFDKALEKPNLGAFLHALAGEPHQLLVRVTAHQGERVELLLTPQTSPASDTVETLTKAVSGTFSGLLPETAGSVAVLGLAAFLPSADRQQELSWRLLPYVPAWLQLGYAMLFAVGLGMAGTLRGWWRKVWPPEVRSEYGGPFGHGLAMGVRSLLYVLLFNPLMALPALLAGVVRWFRSRATLAPTVSSSPSGVTGS